MSQMADLQILFSDSSDPITVAEAVAATMIASAGVTVDNSVMIHRFITARTKMLGEALGGSITTEAIDPELAGQIALSLFEQAMNDYQKTLSF